MGEIRARDADRDRYVDAIEAAYADGQLGDADRDLRVSRALTAETLDELHLITRDLQNRPAPVVVRDPEPVPAPPVRARTDGAAGTVAGLVAALIVGVGFVSVLAAGQSSDESTGIAVPAPEPFTASRVPTYAMKAAGVRDFVDAYRDRFGPNEPYEVTFFPRRAVAQVPLPGPGPRYEVWSWDGTWTRDATGATLGDPHARVDLGELDAGRLVDNVRLARTALRVERGRLGRAVLGRSGDDPAVVTIRITNTFNETGSLTTTPAGEILGRQPYAR